MAAALEDSLSDTSTLSSEEDDGDRLTVEQELGVAQVLLALREKRLEDAKKIAENVPREISARAKKKKGQEITLKTVQLAQIEKPEEGVSEDVEKTGASLTRLEGKYDLSDDEEEGDEEGLVEVSAPEEREGGEEPELAAVTNLLARAIGDATESDQFLQDYFCKGLWKTDGRAETSPDFIATSQTDDAISAETDTLAGPDVIVRELDDDLTELQKADAHEAKFNFRHEVGAKNAITGSHDREKSDMFETVREPSKRALKSREQLALKKVKVQEAKDKLVEDLEIHKGLPSEADLAADEDYPSDQEWFLCDGCSTPIQPTKVMFVCSQCPDYALCKSCQKNKIRHDHPLTRSKCPGSAAPPKSWKLSLQPDTELIKGRGQMLAAQILREISFLPDENYKYISCSSRGEKRSLAELLASAEVEEEAEEAAVPSKSGRLDLGDAKAALKKLVKKKKRRHTVAGVVLESETV